VTGNSDDQLALQVALLILRLERRTDEEPAPEGCLDDVTATL
jgi:hypothetical protein